MSAESLEKNLNLEYTREVFSLIRQSPDITPKNSDLHSVHDIESCAESVVRGISRIERNVSQGRCGGVLVIARGGEKPYLYATQVGGKVRPEKIDKYFTYALAKMAVLVQNPDTTISRENNRLPDDQKLNIEGVEVPGGAVRCKDGTILAFSGFSVDDDESVVLAVAVDSGMLSSQEALKIANFTGNYDYTKIADGLSSF